METKQPGYYRNLMESIETGRPMDEAPGMMPHETEHQDLDEDKGQIMSLAQGILGLLRRARDSQDPAEQHRSVSSAYNSMEDLIDMIRQGGVAEGIMDAEEEDDDADWSQDRHA